MAGFQTEKETPERAAARIAKIAMETNDRGPDRAQSINFHMEGNTDAQDTATEVLAVHMIDAAGYAVGYWKGQIYIAKTPEILAALGHE